MVVIRKSNENTRKKRSVRLKRSRSIHSVNGETNWELGRASSVEMTWIWVEWCRRNDIEYRGVGPRYGRRVNEWLCSEDPRGSPLITRQAKPVWDSEGSPLWWYLSLKYRWWRSVEPEIKENTAENLPVEMIVAVCRVSVTVVKWTTGNGVQ